MSFLKFHDLGGGSQLSQTHESRVPDRPLLWMVTFGGLYVLAFSMNILAAPWLDIVPGQIALIFFPAFIRVMAVLVAGFAGVLGIVAGSFLVCIFLLHQPLLESIWVSLASGLGIMLACWIMRRASREETLPITLPVLLAISVLYSAINALIHGLTWWFLGINEQVTQIELSFMMMGDLIGVVLMFYLLRIGIRIYKSFSARQSPTG